MIRRKFLAGLSALTTSLFPWWHANGQPYVLEERPETQHISDRMPAHRMHAAAKHKSDMTVFNYVPITTAMWAWMEKHRPGAARKLKAAGITRMLVWASVCRTLYEFPGMTIAPGAREQEPFDWDWADFDRNSISEWPCIVTDGAPHFNVQPQPERDPLADSSMRPLFVP